MHTDPEDRRAYMRRRNLEFKERINPLKNSLCLDCDKVLAPCCMEFDHVHGEKRHNIGEMTTWAWETVLEEIKKCELVCCNCHRVRTHLRLPELKSPDADLPRWKYNKALAQQKKILSFRAWLYELKNCPCWDCREVFHPAAMDTDHVRGEKAFSISNGWSYTHEEVLVELEKCDLVCANCHRLRTEDRLSIAA